MAQVGEDGEGRAVDAGGQERGPGLFRHEAGGFQRLGVALVVGKAAAVEHHAALVLHKGADEVGRGRRAGIVDEHRIGERADGAHPPFVLVGLVGQQGNAVRKDGGDEQGVDDGTGIMQDKRALSGGLVILAAAQFDTVEKLQKGTDDRTEHTDSSEMPFNNG